MRHPSKLKLLVSAIAIASFGTANIAMAQQDTTPTDRYQQSVSQSDDKEKADQTGLSQAEESKSTAPETSVSQTDDPQSDRSQSTDNQDEWQSDDDQSDLAQSGNSEDSNGQNQDDMAYEELKTEYATILGDDADSVIASLRNGEDIEYEKTVTIENTTGEIAPHDLSLALALAEKELDDDAGIEELADFLFGEDSAGDGGVLVKHSEGDGWGEIYDQFGYEVADATADDQPAPDAQVSVDTDSAPATRLESQEIDEQVDWDEDSDSFEASDRGDDATPRREIADRAGTPDGNQDQ